MPIWSPGVLGPWSHAHAWFSPPAAIVSGRDKTAKGNTAHLLHIGAELLRIGGRQLKLMEAATAGNLELGKE